jgi:hypothetical protein
MGVLSLSRLAGALVVGWSMAAAMAPARAAEVLVPPGWVRGGSAVAPATRPTWEALLFAQLEEGDRDWLPRQQRLPDGRIRYVYKRRIGDPPLSPQQLEALLRDPPRYEREHRTIAILLAQLRHLGVTLTLQAPRQPSASGEWNPRTATVRIRADVPSGGSRLFALVLNHEAIHVAQSCQGGGVRLPPVPLGLPRSLGPQERKLLADPAYRQASPRVLHLEQEAFANQANLALGPSLLSSRCGAPARLAP